MGLDTLRSAARSKSTHRDVRVLAAYSKVSVAMSELTAALQSAGTAHCSDVATPASPIRHASTAPEVASTHLAIVPFTRAEIACEDTHATGSNAWLKQLSVRQAVLACLAACAALLLPRLCTAVVARAIEALVVQAVHAIAVSAEGLLSMTSRLADRLADELLTAPSPMPAPTVDPSDPTAQKGYPSWGTLLVGMLLGRNYL